MWVEPIVAMFINERNLVGEGEQRLVNHIIFEFFFCHLGFNSTFCLWCHERQGFTCKFRNAQSAFENLHVDALSFIPRNNKKKSNSTILIFILYQNYSVLAKKKCFIQNGRHPYNPTAHTPRERLHPRMNAKYCLMFAYTKAENTGFSYIISSIGKIFCLLIKWISNIRNKFSNIKNKKKYLKNLNLYQNIFLY